MRKLLGIGAVVLVAVIGFAAGRSIAAGARTYQFTGEVREIDAKSRTITVDKGGDVWEFSTVGLKDLKVKKGSRVTVYYEMVARKVELK